MRNRNCPQKAFTLIELLVTIAIISILAAIIFPVLAQAREKARTAACINNCNQMGMAIQMYLQDNDEQMLFYAKSKPGQSRNGASTPDSQIDAERWWNVLHPYLKNSKVFVCPSDPAPILSNDENGNPDIARSYIAARFSESLKLEQISTPSDTIVIMDKRDKDQTGKAITDSWIEPFNGDFYPDTANPSLMRVAGNRHQGRVSCVLFDGHVKAFLPDTIRQSIDLTGCRLVYEYPIAGVMDISVGGVNNICNPVNSPHFTYP